MDNVDVEKFMIEVDGVEKEAVVLKTVELDGKKYVIYTIDNKNDTSDVFVSEVVVDDEGYDKLVDIEDENIKNKLFEIVNIIFS